MNTWQRLVLAFGVLCLACAPVAAWAHGAPENPVSRAVACGQGQRASAQSGACRAALVESPTLTSGGWDNIRVTSVRGRDREVIPDGKLCSAGLDRYRGLDLPRRDWPTTDLTSTSFTYRSTIPHKGTFRLYITKNGYDPAKPLKWSNLETAPFVTVKDPPLRNGVYTFDAPIPTGRTGRHLIYTIWQNSDTPDTYYSCSDVRLADAAVERQAVATDVASDSPRALSITVAAIALLGAVLTFALRRRPQL